MCKNVKHVKSVKNVKTVQIFILFYCRSNAIQLQLFIDAAGGRYVSYSFNFLPLKSKNTSEKIKNRK